MWQELESSVIANKKTEIMSARKMDEKRFENDMKWQMQPILLLMHLEKKLMYGGA